MIYTFLDTGILDELLKIPAHSNAEDSEKIKEEFRERIDSGEKLIIPFAQ